MNKLREALKPLMRALEIEGSDTLGIAYPTPDSKVLWVASGSWSGSQAVTMGDLRKVVAAYRDFAGKQPTREAVAKTLYALNPHLSAKNEPVDFGYDSSEKALALKQADALITLLRALDPNTP